jgi:hypothetical protein
MGPGASRAPRNNIRPRRRAQIPQSAGSVASGLHFAKRVASLIAGFYGFSVLSAGRKPWESEKEHAIAARSPSRSSCRMDLKTSEGAIALCAGEKER